MTTLPLGIIVNGATGGIARRQHLVNALVPIIRQGGLRVGDDLVLPELMLVGRDEGRLSGLAGKLGIARWTTDLDAALADQDFTLFFDAGRTGRRAQAIDAAIAAGKHVYAEKPVVTDGAAGRDLIRRARAAGVKVGVVEDKLFLPGLVKLRHLARSGFFGTVTNFRFDFGFWFFDGHDFPDQRGSWNYRAAEGGGLVMDTFPHWRYVIEGILGPISALVARTWTAIPHRRDEQGMAYTADADDSSVTLLELTSGAVGSVRVSAATRVRADDLISFQIDGTNGSAVAGLHRCHIQPAAATPKAIFHPDADLGIDYRDDWQRMPDVLPATNGYRMGWEAFMRHVVAGTALVADLAAGLRDVALAEAVLASSAERRWVSLDDFTPADRAGS